MKAIPAVVITVLLAGLVGISPKAFAAEEDLRTVSGVVVSDEGKPLAGVNVDAWTYPPKGREPEGEPYAVSGSRGGFPGSTHTVTDAEGRFSLKVPAGTGHLNAYFPEWRQSTSQEIDVTDADLTDVRLIFQTPPPKTAIIEGRVVDADGKPVPDAVVRLEGGCCYAYPMTPMPMPTPASSEGGDDGASSDEAPATASSRPAVMPAPPGCCHDDWQETRSDADGRFRFETYPGQRQVSASARGYAQDHTLVEAKANDTVSATLELEKLPPNDAKVVGRVVDAETGLPLANAYVSVRSLEWGRYQGAQTGADGTFRVTMLRGWIEVSVSYWGEPYAVAVAEGDLAKGAPAAPGRQYYPNARILQVGGGDNELKVELMPKPKPTLALLGYVVDPETKKAVAGATVNVWNQDTGDWGTAVTDATGSYKILVRPGHHQASAWKEGYLGGSQSFVVRDEATQRQDILLPKGEAKHVPCYDDECGGPIMYDRAMPAHAPTASKSGGPGATAASEDAARTSDAPAPVPMTAEGGANSPGGDTRASAMTYQGTGGGLPPYDPADASSTQGGGDHGDAVDGPGAGENAVPAPAALALVAVAGALALALRRRG